MKKNLHITLALSLCLFSANAAMAGDAIWGAVLGGGAGALVGQSIGGRDGGDLSCHPDHTHLQPHTPDVAGYEQAESNRPVAAGNTLIARNTPVLVSSTPVAARSSHEDGCFAIR